MKFTKPKLSGNNGGCWEVANSGSAWFVRDTKNKGLGPVLEYTAGQWLDMLAAVKHGRWPAWVTLLADGGAEVRMPGITEPVLRFNAVEMDAFARSVRLGQREFQPVSV